MSDHQYRIHSRRQKSLDTTENLYDLGLLKRPKEGSLSGTIESSRSRSTTHGKPTHTRIHVKVAPEKYCCLDA